MRILKKMLPHIAAVVVFVVVVLTYFSPLLEGKRIDQYDIKQAGGSAKEVADFREKTGKEALWTNSVFGGMPAYHISVKYKNNILSYINLVLTGGLPAPAYMLFIAMLGFYVTLLCFKVNPWLSIAGAFAYGLSTYFVLIIGAGHNTKMRALEYMPPIFGGLYLAYHRRKVFVGMIITCLALGLQILHNHLQITYYTAIIVLIFLIFELVHVIRDSRYGDFIKASAAMIIALTLSVGANITNLLLTAEYAPYSTRGVSELTDESGDQTKGLDKSYILNNYSYGIAETMDLFIPYFAGGPMSTADARKSPLHDAFVKQGYPKNEAVKYAKHMTYWGGQDGGTSGPVYLGAVVVFLFVLGLFVVKGRIKWWLVTATCLSVLLAWGKHFRAFSDLFIDYFPMYSKFRTVSMILVIAEFTVPLLGILALQKMFDNEITADDKKKALKKSFFITGGIALFFVLFPGLFFGFSTPAEADYPDWLVTVLHDARQGMLRQDAFRSLFFVTAAAAVLWFAIKDKLKMAPACVLFAALILIDLWMVGKRYLNEENFKEAKKANTVQPTSADLAIMQDKSPDYRVLNLTVDPFSDATTSYFHKSLGGYHGAKMKRYQELIERHVSKFNKNVLNMLNTKYLIVPDDQRQPVPQQNPDALGNAWTISEINWVDNADEEISALTDFDPGKTAVIDKRYRPAVGDFTAAHDSAASIKLVEYEPNRLLYEYRSREPQMVVFSEIFYDKGWNAYINGELKPHIRADYVLRAMVVPAGEHKIEFRFEPESYALGEKISLVGSIGIVLLVLGVIFKETFDAKRKSSTPENGH